jgi:ferric-dicitrate binding protein FerR (iron transport regulator)
MREDVLEKAVAAVRNQAPDPEAVESAVRRVADRIASGDAGAAPVDETPVVLRGCADIQALVPAFVAGRLSTARALLVEDHTRSCVPCRRVLKAARSGVPITAPPAAVPSVRRRPVAAWALAASLVLAAALGALWLVRSSAPSGPVARVDVVDGLLLVPAAGTPLPAGAGLEGGQAVRTGRSGGALLVLADGSRVELAERSEVSIARGSGGTTVALARGRVIVQAAKQRGGHLYVRTPDCLVSVTGTVFSVAQGARGSRVSVLEGEVHVDDGRGEKVLHGGDQTTTNGAVARETLEAEFGWSRNRVALLELAGEVLRVRKELSATPSSWSGRTSTRLLDAMPDGTVVYASVPNVSGTVADFYDALSPRLASNPVLASWWTEGPGASARQAEVKRLLDALRTWGSYLGDEVALGVGTSAEAHPGAPLVLTTVVRPGFRAFLESELARDGGKAHFRIVENASDAPPGGGDGLLLWLHDDLVAAALDGATLTRLEAALASPGAFRSGTFRARLADAYRDGVDLLVGIDVKALLAKATSAAGKEPRTGEALRMSGLLDVEHLIVERRSSGDASTGRAALTFSSQRRGLAAWLSAPASMGSLSFVSSGASGAMALVIKEPALLVEDLFSFFSAGHPDFPSKLAQFEAEHGFRVKADLAETLGGDVALAVDGPLLPTPAVKLVVEVYDPARLQATLERLVSLADAAARKDGKPGVKLVAETSGGLTIHALVTGDGSTPLQYAFVDGYLVAASEKALVLRAAEVHRTGDTLLTAPKLVALLPKDGPLDFSMLAFQDVGGALGSLARSIGAAPGSAASDLSTSGASLGWAWAEPSRIVFGSAGTSLSDIGSLVAATAALSPSRAGGR